MLSEKSEFLTTSNNNNNSRKKCHKKTTSCKKKIERKKTNAQGLLCNYGKTTPFRLPLSHNTHTHTSTLPVFLLCTTLNTVQLSIKKTKKKNLKKKQQKNQKFFFFFMTCEWLRFVIKFFLLLSFLAFILTLPSLYIR